MFIFDLHILLKSNNPFTATVSIGENGEKLEPSYIAGKNVKWYSTVEKSLMVPQKD